jgi:hypothetical protein
MIEFPKDDTLTYKQRHPVLMERVKWAMIILGILQFAVCIACAVWGGNVVDYAGVESFVRGMDWVIPAVGRLGSLSLNPGVGRFTFAMGMIVTIPFNLAFFIWGLFYRTMDEQFIYLSKKSTRKRISLLVPLIYLTSSVLTDMGLINWIGLATAKHIYDRPNQPYVHFLVSEGVKYGIAAAVFCMFIGFGYNLFLIMWVKVVPALIKVTISGAPQTDRRLF